MAKDFKISSAGQVEPTPLWCSARLTMSIVSFLGFVNLYALRVNLSVAMVCMVNQTYVASLHDNSGSNHHIIAKGTVNDTGENYTTVDVSGGGGENSCDSISAGGGGNGTDTLEDGEFSWSKETQGLILGSFFWGYLLTQLPGGWLASRYGGKRVLGYCMCACSLLTLLMPIAARTDWRFLMGLRILAGICQGVVWPCMQMLWGCWAPPLETGKLAGFCYAGSQIGNVLTFPIAGLLCKYGFDGGWPAVFYVLGAYGLLWFVLWMFLVFDSPAVHPRISPEERHYIEYSLRGRSAVGGASRHDKIPWRKILTSKRVWAIVVTNVCANWGTYTFLTNIPTYMREVLKFDIKKNGLLSSLPYIGFWLAINVSGQLFDFLQSRGTLTTTAARKISNSLGEIVPALFVIGVGFMDCTNPVGGVVLLTVGVSMCGFQYGSGFIVNAGDIAPRYAGIIFGISNTFGTIPGFLAPIAIGIITSEQTQAQWRTVFFICAGIYTFGTIFYLICGSGDLQTWARHELTLEIPPPLLKDKDDAMLKSRPTNNKDGGLLSSAEQNATLEMY
ncbi:sialin-like [Littorina saxatilis]|uniref:Major facilitator superfamily (MFS) profile domain-containing protein n=1 Tax=Littorina saxatilis TaxID=31220 RepID=A0AAN9B3J3_9CAEN